MKRLLSILILLSLIVSCQDINRTPKPDNLIPEDKMVDVLTEISLLHGARSYNRALMEEKGIDPYPYLSNKFGIDSTQLVRSNEYYAQNYRQYKRIYDSVKVRLEALVVEYDSIREMEKQRDTLRKKPRRNGIPLRRLSEDSLLPRGAKEEMPAPVSIQ